MLRRAQGSVGERTHNPDPLGWLIERATKAKEAIALFIGLGAAAIAAINYFVTKDELKRLNCQVMSMIAMHDNQLAIAALKVEIVKLNMDYEKLTAYEKGAVVAPNIAFIVQQNRNTVASLESQVATEKKASEDKRRVLERGECHMNFESQKIKSASATAQAYD